MYDCLPTEFLKSTDRCIVSDQQHAIVLNEAPYHMVPTKVADVRDWMASKTGRVFGFLKTQMESARPARLHKAAGTPKGRLARLRGLPATVRIAAGTYRWEPAKIAERKAAFSTQSGSWDTSGFQFQ